MDEILVEFAAETKDLTGQLEEILESVEEDPSKFAELEQFGQVVDRIMGGAKTLSLDLPAGHPMHALASFAEICKLIGYKASQSGTKPALITTAVAFLLDATEMINDLNGQLVSGAKVVPNVNMGGVLRTTFLERLKWLATKFDADLAASVSVQRSTQSDVDAILKQLGMKL